MPRSITIRGKLRADTPAFTYATDKNSVFTLGKDEHIVPPDAKTVIVCDAEAGGLQLRMWRSGARSYSYRGRVRGVANPITVKIGDAPAVTLAAARAKALKIRALCQQGINPNAERDGRIAADKAAAAARREFRAVADEYLAEYAEGALPHQRRAPRPRSVESERLDVTRANRVLGAVAIDQLGVGHVRQLSKSAREISADGDNRLSAEAVKRAFGAARRVTDHALALGLLDNNPFRSVAAPAGSVRRDRYLTTTELSVVWATACRLDRPFDHVLRFLIAMPVRRSIALEMRWADVDLGNRVLRVRPEVTGNKSTVEWRLPMNEFALEAMGEPAHPNDLVFVGHHGGEVSLTTSKKVLDRESGVTEWQLHDLRRTASTLTSDAIEDVDEDALDLWLMHGRKGVKGTYQRAPRVSAMRRAANDWGRVLGQIVGRENINTSRGPTDV